MEEIILLKSLQAGKEKAFELLVENYQVKVYNTILGFVKSPEDAEDLAQEVFIEVFNSVTKFRAEASLSTWIYRIAVNKALEFIRKQKRLKRFAFLTNLFDASAKEKITTTDFVHPGILMENKERGVILFGAIDKLPENQKVAFTLHKIEGLSYQEIAKVMNISLSAVESLMFRAKKNLRRELSAYYSKNK